MSSGYSAQDRLPVELSDFVDDAVTLISGRPLEEIDHAPMSLPPVPDAEESETDEMITELRRRIFERLDYDQMQLVLDASVERSSSIIGFLSDIRTGRTKVPRDAQDAIRSRCRVMIQSIDALNRVLGDFLASRKS